MEHQLPPETLGRNIMNSFRMKALSLAVLSLAGLGMAGSAFAVTCPVADQTKDTPHSPGGGGAWTSQFISGDAALQIVTPGLNGTGCALAVAVGANSTSRVFVEDDSPHNETRYRARFYVSLAALALFGGDSAHTGVVFKVNDATSPGAFTSDQLVVRLAGSPTAPTVRFFVADANSTITGIRPIVFTLPASATHTWRIETDLQIGTAATSVAGGCTTMPASGGCFRYWVSDAAAASGSDSAPDGSFTVNNSGWSGAETAFLGLQTTTPNFRTDDHGILIVLDEFDSRRQTFIGK
jgi:hypothetical protein